MPTSDRARDRATPGRRAILLFWILATVAYCSFAAARWRSGGPTDFYLLWSVGQALRELPVENVYTEPDRSAITAELRDRSIASGSPTRIAGALGWNRFEPISTPFLYAIFSLASSGDFDRDYELFRLVSLAGYAAAVFGLALAAGFGPGAAFLAVVAFTALYWPFYTDSGFANVGQLQVGLVGLYVAISRRDAVASDLVGGGVLGFLLFFKPTVVFCAALLAASWLIGRRWRKLGYQSVGVGAMALVAAVLPSLLFGGACSWLEWQRRAPEIFLTGRYLGGGFLGRMFGPLPLWIYPLFSAAVLGAVLMLVVRRLGPRSDRVAREAPGELLTLVAVGLALFVVTTPVAHSHYFLLVVPLALLAVAPGRPHRLRWAGAGAILLIALHPAWRALGLTSGRNHSLWAFAGAWLLLFLVLPGFARSRTAPVRDRATD